jgi:hypothetical protein
VITPPWIIAKNANDIAPPHSRGDRMNMVERELSFDTGGLPRRFGGMRHGRGSALCSSLSIVMTSPGD